MEGRISHGLFVHSLEISCLMMDSSGDGLCPVALEARDVGRVEGRQPFPPHAIFVIFVEFSALNSLEHH